MASLIHPTDDVSVRLGPTLRSRPHRKRPYRAAVRSALQVAIVVAAVLVILQWQEHGAFQTLTFGIAAVLYLIADFAMELPVDGRR